MAHSALVHYAADTDCCKLERLLAVADTDAMAAGDLIELTLVVLLMSVVHVHMDRKEAEDEPNTADLATKKKSI